MKTAYFYDPETLLYQGQSDEQKVSGYEDYLLPQFATFNAIPAFDSHTEQCQYQPDTDSWSVERKPVEVTAYHKQTQAEKVFDDIRLVSTEYTTDKPVTECDEFIDNKWVTNLTKQYKEALQSVTQTRRALYNQEVDPLIAEANIKRLMAEDEDHSESKEALLLEAKHNESQAIRMRKQIQADNPFPTNPA